MSDISVIEINDDAGKIDVDDVDKVVFDKIDVDKNDVDKILYINDIMVNLLL
jgi:hypothetical protein